MSKFNRAQRRAFASGEKKRGVGYTRQWSSKRAREKFGTVCKGEQDQIEHQRTVAMAQKAREEGQQEAEIRERAEREIAS